MKFSYKELTVEDAHNEMIYKLLRDCSDFFLDFEDEEPTFETLKSIITEVPKDYSIEDKLVLSILKNNEIIGLIDILKDFPDEKSWMIGLLIINPKFRSLGFGKIIHKDIQNLVRQNRIQILRIGVMEKNLNGLKFWKSLGYSFLKKTKLNYKTVIIMTLDI